jgi:hypothetical protein
MNRFTSRIDMRFIYTNAADSAKPGYLARKFREAQRRIDEEKARRDAEAASAQVEAASIELEVQRKVRVMR